MKVARIYDFDDIRIEDAPVPAIGPREILVKTQASGICSGDVMPWYIRKKAPLVLGHEPAGVISQAGSEVQGFKVGDRVFVHHHAPCFQCHYCRHGDYSMCHEWKNSHLDPGGMAEFFRVPAQNLSDTLVLPEGVTFEDGALVEPVACCVQAIRRSAISQGDAVLVIGLGVMGQILCLLARRYGAGLVVASDYVPARRQLAQSLGVDAVVDPSAEDPGDVVRRLTRGIGADVVITGPPSTAAIRSGISCVARGGTVVMFAPAPPGETMEIEPHSLYFNDITIIPSYSCGPNDTREALRLIECGVVRAQDLVTHRYPFSQVARAYSDMAQGGDVIKAMVLFE
ncbi:MAG: alcohol dehydrogenase catalytic domain-containing protein [Firmicutes bacterium]|nr:alcohol dehydrogenase catalytic domain-containing protein [Bacillota bacterium]